MIALDLQRVIKEGHALLKGPSWFNDVYSLNIIKNDNESFCSVLDKALKFEIEFKTPIFLRGYSFKTKTDRP